MKKIVFATMFLALLAEGAAAQPKKTKPPQKRSAPVSQLQRSSARPITAEEAFFYYTAIFGEELNNSFISGAANNVVDRYALAFDAGNYARAMPDEFSRAKYRETIRARIAAGVGRVDFSHKFIAIGGASLNEYNFASHSFPFTPGAGSSFCLGPSCSNLRVDVGIQDAINVRDFNWSLAIPESEASAFLKSRTFAGGGSNRGVTLRVTYSIVPLQGRPPVQGSSTVPQHASLRPFIHSVEIYTDQSLSKRLGVVASQHGIPESAYSIQVSHAARSASTVIGKYKYKTYCRNYRCTDLATGTITLTDVGVTLSGEQEDGSTKPNYVGFFDTFAADLTDLWRADYDSPFDWRDYRVVWRPFWNQDYQSRLAFGDRQERDHFFTGLTQAMLQWKVKYPQFAANELKIRQDCQHQGGDWVTCPETKPQAWNSEGAVILPSGLRYKIVTKGTGPKPVVTDTVNCNYRGTFIDGKEFDSSYKRGKTGVFPVNGVIKGWKEALQLMPVGSKWELLVPPELAYGALGAGASIPPNATLIYEVELISVQAK